MDLLWKERKRIWCGLPLTFTVYSYDNERFYVKSGFLNQRQDEVRLYRVQDLTVTRSLSQRIFGMGTILVNSSDKTLGDLCNQNVKFPVSIEKGYRKFFICVPAFPVVFFLQSGFLPDRQSPAFSFPYTLRNRSVLNNAHML